MTQHNRREFLGTLAKFAGATTITTLLPPSIERALAIPAHRHSGSIRDVEHIVILMQENRSFDHYFGTMHGVRGFGDPFPIPTPNRSGIYNKNIWYQPKEGFSFTSSAIVPFHLNTNKNFEHMRVEGTPHSWNNAQNAWNHGRMNEWPLAKRNHSMGYFTKDDIPFQWALANSFTICDAYHCSLHTGTNPNRLFLWTGTNDPLALDNGPATYNDYEGFEGDPGGNGGYTWTTYAERLQGKGITWQVYENMDDNFGDNPLAGFRNFRDAWFQRPGYSQALRERGVSTRDLDKLMQDVLADRLPQVSWIVSTAEGSEHPGPSSPAQGAAYIARVLAALTANPDVWSKTVLFVNFDENDGFFDHMPPPAPPSYASWDRDATKAVLAGASTVDTTGEYHEHLVSYHSSRDEQNLLHCPYGLGPRVPLYVISPWSKGGWVNSQVFDHTSIIRFIETRFGVHEPNISPWRRAVCGDLTTAFDFAHSDTRKFVLPATNERAQRARELGDTSRPPTPADILLPVQEEGIRPSRALPYELHVNSLVRSKAIVELDFVNTGGVAAVFHVYDRLHLENIPRRYTVESGRSLAGSWKASAAGNYDLWIIGPNGFHRHFCGKTADIAASRYASTEVNVAYDLSQKSLIVTLRNAGHETAIFSVIANKYYDLAPTIHPVAGQRQLEVTLPLTNNPWYDFSVTVERQETFLRRFAGRMEIGIDTISDPAMGGVARPEPYRMPSFEY